MVYLYPSVSRALILFLERVELLKNLSIARRTVVLESISFNLLVLYTLLTFDQYGVSPA